uniref:Peptidase M3A/M3B catalytic domain-containing protein n=1 Tax=Parascaris univalens TaxID=6257 RepID=A0A915B6D4_PARUN
SLYSKRYDMDNWKVRLLEYYLLEMKASGLDRHDEKTRKLIGSWSKFVDEYRAKYLTNIMTTNDQYMFTVIDRAILKDAPPHILRILATDHEGWAKTLGYASVSEHRLANKMAGSPETVRSFISALTKRMRPVFMDRMEAWSAFAAAKEMITTELQPFDLFYICRKEAEHHYEVDPLSLMKHFPFWETFANLIEVLSHIFNLKFEDVTADTKLERCSTDVKIFSVDDLTSGRHLGRLYVDAFERPNKRGNWNTLLGRTANEARGLDKLVYMIGAADAPTADSPSLLHYLQLQQLLFHTGRALQLLLSQSPYRDVTVPWAPMYAADWDAADLLPAFTQFFIYKPNLLNVLSSKHLITGEVMSESRANAVAMGLSRATLWESYRVLFWADFDLSIFELEDRKKKFWLDMYRDLYKEYFPFKLARNDYHPCSFTPIFAMQPYMSMYYRKLWTEMLALDVHETFDIEDDVRATGERLKNTIFMRGAGDVQSELYRRFQASIVYSYGRFILELYIGSSY